ncbi:MAG: hypothetical protein K9M98_10695 [Cephaloticoccus sp.]|nr:hypothetical protein [Cephaloticoccus sp.]MCF7760959.1 hypothetical protein [Cephaloticoccus sp.]
MNPSPIEPRQMLRRHLIARGHAGLTAGHERFAADARADPLAAGAKVQARFARYYGDLLATLAAKPLKARQVGGGNGRGFRYENWLFESHPGWEVNATLFLPLHLSPPYPPVVMSVGHSGKQFSSYQLPCQYFARAGLAAVVFDPPGVAGEKRPGNDHFDDGVRCYLTGDTSNRYFIGDTLRSMDFLAARADIDPSHGFALTGVSGGGHSSLYAGLLDPRATLIAPSCCLISQGKFVLDLSYSSCPETLMPGRLSDGLDDDILLCALAPRPVLLMAGINDEVYTIDDSRRIAAAASTHFAATGHPDRFQFFADQGGHNYSLNQAREFVHFVRRHWNLSAPVPLPATTADEFTLLEPDQMSCHPRAEANMRTLTRDRAAVLAANRQPPGSGKLHEFLALDPAMLSPCSTSRAAAVRAWFHDWEEFSVETEPGISVQLTRADPGPAHPALWHFDDQGRQRLVTRGGLLAQAIGQADRDSIKAALFSADLRGWGETAMAAHPYESVSWGAPDRFAAYVGAGVGEAPAAMRIRDAWQLTRAFPLRRHTVLSAVGAAGPVALHLAALLPGKFTAVVLSDAPAGYADLLATEEFAWPHDLILPEVLQHYDLPLLAQSAGCPVYWLNPLDGAGLPLSADECAHRTHDNQHWQIATSPGGHLNLLGELLYD